MEYARQTYGTPTEMLEQREVEFALFDHLDRLGHSQGNETNNLNDRAHDARLGEASG